MSDRESTQVGYRLRIQPTDLSTYPDRAKLVWFDLVVKYGLIAKGRDLRRGKDKNGDTHALAPRTIKYRRSEVGPVTKTAPRGIPALDVSRVMSLLIGRAHTSSAEFWWGFDSVTGESFAKILHYWADDQGHDVFGLSPQGTAWTLAQAAKDWEAWKASPEAQRLTAGRPGIPAARKVRKQLPKMSVKQNLEDYDLFVGAKPLIEKAIAEGRFPGFRRLNARGEQWKPGHALGPGRQPPPQPTAPVRPAPGAINLPVTRFIPATLTVPIVSREQIDALFKVAKKEHVSAVPVGLLRVQSDRVGALQDLVNKRILEWYRDHPSSEPIAVIFENGKFFIHEGHHRAAAAAMRGNFSIPGMIFRRKPGTRAEAELLVMDDNGNLHPVTP
jgi:hypothetical protein